MSSSSTVENGFIAQSIVPLPLDILEKHGILWNVNGLDEIGLELISEKIGFLSMVYRVFMKVDQEKSIIIKIPTDDYLQKSIATDLPEEIKQVEFLANRQMIMDMHKRELRFYANYGNRFLQGPMKCPRYFYGRDFGNFDLPAFIMMEDLSQQSAGTQISIGLNDEKVLALVDAIAHLQAETITDHSKTVEFSKIDSFNLIFVKYAKNALIKLNSQNLPFLTIYRQQKLSALCNIDRVNDLLNLSEGPQGQWRVVVHGDLWPHNILWRKTADGKAGNELRGLVDWQTTRYGSFGADLAGILGLSCDGEYRRRNCKRVLEYYLGQLKFHMNGVDLPITFEQIQQSYKKNLQFTCLQMLLTVTMNEDNAEGVLMKRFRMLIEDLFPEEQ